MKKDLLIIAKSLGGGGSEVALIEFINHLDLNKYNITLLLMDHDTEYKYRLNKTITINYIQFDNEIYHNLVSMYSILGKGIKKLCINKYVKIYNLVTKHSRKIKKHFDIAIDFYGYGSFTTAYLALNVLADKKVFWLHDEKMPWIKNVEKYFDYYDTVCCVSKAIKNSFDTMYPHYSDKSLVFYNVIDIQNIINKSMAFYPVELKNNIFNIVTVGRLTEQKGYDVAIKAAAILKNKGIQFKWFAIGDGKDKNKLNKLINKNKLKNTFILLGRKDNPYPYIRNCDLFVLESRHEGYSVALVEARVLKKLIITSDFPANKEQIVNKKNGLISKINPDDLAKKIEQIYFDKKLQKNIIKNLQEQEINFDDEIKKLDCI